MIVVTHAMDFARNVAHTVHVMHAGRVAESGPPGPIFDRPAGRSYAYRFWRKRRFIERIFIWNQCRKDDPHLPLTTGFTLFRNWPKQAETPVTSGNSVSRRWGIATQLWD